MTLHAQKFAFAGAATSGVLYVLCALFSAIAPAVALQSFGWLFHMVNMEKYAPDFQVVFPGVLWGLVQVVVYVFVWLWLMATFYNKFVQNQK